MNTFQRHQILIVALILVFPVIATAQDKLNRRVAVTFDDLPVAGSAGKDLQVRRNLTLNLLQSLVMRNIPAIGFVNEGKLYANNVPDDAQVDLLRLWLAAGFDLGNHSYSHPDLNTTPLEEFQSDVILGEKITKDLLAERNRRPEYFRHPFLHTGTEIGKKQAFESYLAEHGYRVAPVSIDNSEWIFARAYDLLIRAGDTTLAAQVGREYVEYMLKVFAFYEDQSDQLFARNIDHVLLVHANKMNSAWFGVLADRLFEQGYEFITLKEALKDPAYASPDTYVGPGGITWIHRWAMTRQVDPAMFRGEPETPPHILKLTELREHNYPAESQE